MSAAPAGAAALQLRAVAADDPLLAPVLADLHRDYAARYPGLDVELEMSRHPPAEFAAPDGAFLVLLADGQGGPEVVAAGAYRRYEAGTAELKRVWTSPGRRRLGLARRIVEALEQSALAAGYSRVFLTTGPRQPEARALYLSLGYTPVGDHDALVAQAAQPLPFVKALRPAGDALRRAFGCFPTGVAALAAVVDGAPVGMAVSSFTSVSLDPPLAAVCVARTSGTWPVLRRSDELGVSVLSAEQGAAGRRLSSREPDRFAGLSWDELPGQALLVHGAAATLRTRVDREVEAGDHLLVLLEVLAVEAFPEVTPLVFHASTFHRLEAP